jgi:hypothetical protein
VGKLSVGGLNSAQAKCLAQVWPRKRLDCRDYRPSPAGALCNEGFQGPSNFPPVQVLFFLREGRGGRGAAWLRGGSLCWGSAGTVSPQQEGIRSDSGRTFSQPGYGRTCLGTLAPGALTLREAPMDMTHTGRQEKVQKAKLKLSSQQQCPMPQALPAAHRPRPATQCTATQLPGSSQNLAFSRLSQSSTTLPGGGAPSSKGQSCGGKQLRTCTGGC